jgi:SAM-dependent methyltransferase
MRELVGPTDPSAFDNPTSDLVYPYLPEQAYDSVFDFGCGCGRVARQLLQQRSRPRRYLGIDQHLGMIEWCRENLGPRAPGFEFVHHDVFNYHFNPGSGKPEVLPFPAEAESATLINAFSVFTHLTQSQADYYLTEVSRILAPSGIFHSTWFLFDKRDFPVLQTNNAALYVDYVDPGAAVLFDRAWVIGRARAMGLLLTDVVPPSIRGYQWTLVMRRANESVDEITLPEDTAQVGQVTLPSMPHDANRIGLA